VRLEMRETNADDSRVTSYKSVETLDKETTIAEFVERFHGKHSKKALAQLLGIHNQIRLGNQLYTFLDENGEPLTEDTDNGESA
jgi:hypothetical protein